MLDEVLATDQVGFPILSVMIALPLLAAVVLLVVRDRRTAAVVALAAAGIETVLAGGVVVGFAGGVADVQLVERSAPLLGVSWHLGVDGVNVLFVPLIAVLGLLVVGYAVTVGKSSLARYAACVLALQAAMVGAFVALDLVVFWLFFVLELVPAWYLITCWGTGPLRRRAAVEYVSFVGVGAAFMGVGILLLGNQAAATTGERTYELARLLDAGIPNGQQTLIFFLFFLGFAIKAPIFPFHTWLPKVLEHGPVVGLGVFLVGVKLGTYGLLRFLIPLMPGTAAKWFWLMALLGAAGTVYGALLALGQTNLRRMLGYASLAHMGVVMLGLSALNLDGFEGGLLQMINLGIVGAGLFFVAGFLTTRVGPPELRELGGLIHHAPLLTGAFLLLALAGIGLPGTNGFNGEHLVMLGAYERSWLMALAAGVGVFLTAAYFLTFFVRGFMGETRQQVVDRVYDLTTSERGIVVVLLGLVFWIGLGTAPFIQTMRPSLTVLSEHVEDANLVQVEQVATR